MKKSILLLFAAFATLVANAHDFYENGVYYNITSSANLTVEVTYDGINSNMYSGSITIPATVTYKGVNYSVTSIDDWAFAYCSSLTAIIIPEGVTSIGEWAFQGCSSLTSITIPEDSKLTSIGSSAFSGCSSLTAITIPEDSKLTSIGDYAFRGCSSLKGITIPEGVTSIGERAFYYCSSLTAITIPENSQLTSIGDYAFRNCSNLTAITIPKGVTSIGSYAFEDCSSLTAITIPEDSKLTSIGDYAFRGCSSLTAVHISSLEVWCNIDFANSSANPLSSAKNLYLNGGLVKELTIPNSVTAIKNLAFYGCSSLKGITIPESVTSIGEGAFADCSRLTAITIPEGVTSIGESAFAYCSSLTAITIPEGVTSIGYSAFYYCSSLKGITIPEGVTSIGERAFAYCSSLTAITIPENSQLTSIGNDVFYGCTSLTTINIPEGVTSIGDYAFRGCSSLTAITCEAITPPTVGDSQTFYNVNKSIPVYVPAGSIAAYQSAEYWNDFERIEAIKTSVSNITLSQSSITLTEGASITLTAIVTPEDADDSSLTWSSSNEDVAMVSSKGKVVAMGLGTAIITATANDGSGVSAQCEVAVTPASYVITFLVDGEVILTDTLTRGSTINLPDVPEKEGYTFSGWSEVPEAMPAKDVTVSGTFTINKYLVTFKIGDEVIAADSLEFGAAIVAPEAPEKEGYTFSGWSEVPETMPAKDVTISGTFIINKYLVTFMIDDVVLASDSLKYGATITLPSTPPAREGYTFSGWEEVAETVPANDVTYSAYYTANVYKVYYFVGSKLVNMVEVTYGEPIPEYIYEPTTEGDEFLGWIGENYATMPAHDVTYIANIENGIDQVIIDNGQLTIYDLAGRKVLNTENLKSGIYVVNGKKTVIK